MKPSKREQYILCLEKTGMGDLCELYVQKTFGGGLQLTAHETEFTRMVPVIDKYPYISPFLKRSVNYPLLKSPELSGYRDFVPLETYSLVKRIIKAPPK
jgi:hypothetical protein